MIPDEALLNWAPAEPREAQALVRAVLARAAQQGLDLPAAPAEPDNCCGNGCVGCVWDGYYSDLAYWRDEAVLRWSA
ncbi:MAG: hypothetical protein RJA44_1935 [Pseudomonadota bacterium]